jgi:hypothetical protein
MASSAGGVLAAQAGRAAGLTRGLTKTMQQKIQAKPSSSSAQAQDRPKTYLVRRNTILYVFLSVITFGIWGHIWFFRVAGALLELKPDCGVKPFRDWILSVCTFGLYAVYLLFKFPKVLFQIEQERGIQSNDFSIISILLVFFGLALVSWCLIQVHLNTIVDTVRGT